jgi:hypothetical protein
VKASQLFIPLILFSFFILTACNKAAIKEPSVIPPTVLSSDSNYLSKIFFLRGNGSTIDTLVNTFIYDNLKRVSQVLETHTYNSNGVVTKYFDTSKLFYNNAEVLPDRITKLIINPAGTIDTIVNFLSYSNNGILIRDSTISFFHSVNGNYNFNKEISTYSYVSNKIFIYTANTSSMPNSTFIQKDTLLQDANTNIIAKNRSIDYGLNSPNNSSSITTYTYGNNPSPLINLNICNKLGKFEDGYYFLFQGSKNNLKSLNIASYSNGVFQNNVILVDNMDTYTFNTNGYPNSLNFQFPLNPQTKKLVYLYVSL